MKALRALLSIAAIVSASPAVALAPAPSGAPGFHRAYFLIGTWACGNSSDRVATSVFERQDNGSITMTNFVDTDPFESSRKSSEFHESYIFDDWKGVWKWTSRDTAHPDVSESGTASDWIGNRWVFEGSIADARRQMPERMVFTYLSDTEFEREFDVYQNGEWVRTSASTCTRAIEVPKSFR
jgi:hypothetical protein